MLKMMNKKRRMNRMMRKAVCLKNNYKDKKLVH